MGADEREVMRSSPLDDGMGAGSRANEEPARNAGQVGWAS